MNFLRFTACFLVLLSACVLPQPNELPDNFVSKKEQVAITLIREANESFLKGRYIDAEINYRKALYLFPNAVNTKVNLFNTLIRLGLFAEARGLLRELKDTDYAKYDLTLSRAIYAYLNMDFEQAIKSYQNVLTLPVKDPVQEGVKENVLQANAYEKISSNLSSLSFLVGKEEDSLCFAYQANFFAKNPRQKARVNRLRLALGLKDLYKESEDSQINIGQEQKDLLVLEAISRYLNADLNSALNIISQLEELLGAGINSYPEITLVHYLIDKIENRVDSEFDHEEALELISATYNDGKFGSQIRLYWPVDLIDHLVVIGQSQSKE